ncbi:MAG: ORF6N domain-containing protein [Betaproteobacteria bacterium]|nr:MAG: ORF6N domain-containing protein [Betaproteobacteria bacterium]
MDPVEAIAQRILVVRNRRVVLDSDLAVLYGVTPKRFNEQVRRNLRRFPADFMSKLTNQEVANLRSQFATSSWGEQRWRPIARSSSGSTRLSRNSVRTIARSAKSSPRFAHSPRRPIRRRSAGSASFRADPSAPRPWADPSSRPASAATRWRARSARR